MIPLFLAALFTITSDRLDVTIDDASGALVSVVDRRDNMKLLEKSGDLYVLQRTPKEEIIAREAEDRVVRKQGDVWICTNPKLPGVLIEKTWRIEGRWLTKRVAFSTERKDLGLLKYSTVSTAAPSFYRDGYLNDPSRHPIEYPYVFTKDLKAERQMPDFNHAADHHYAIFTNPRLQRGIAQYRLKVDDRFVHPLSSYSYEPGLYYGPTGWRIAVAAQWLTKGQRLSAEVRWHVFDGDHVNFHREYMALPDYASQWGFKSPEWVKDVRATENWEFGVSSPDLSRFKAKADAMGDGYLMVLIGGVFHNTRDYLADPIQTPCGIPANAADLRNVVDQLHALSPRIKVGPLTWQWGFGPLDPVFRQHPEWTVHDGAGEPVFVATGWAWEKVFSQLLTPACRKFDVEQFRGMAKRYDFDFIYMDTGQGGITQFDWRTHRCAQDYDWADLYRGIRDAARSNRDGAAFFNGTPGFYSSFCDCGYFEGMGHIKVRDWRAMADRLFLVKLYQPDEKWTMPLYWTPEISEYYINCCLALGLKPGTFLDNAQLGNSRWPLLAAAQELESLRLVPEANPRPCWWKEKTEHEVYALRYSDGAFLNCLSHADRDQKPQVSCDLEPFHFDPARPIHAWLFRSRSVESLQKTVGVTEVEANAIFAREGVAPHRAIEGRFLRSLPGNERHFQETLSIEPGALQLVMLTQSPTLAYAVDGRPTHFLLPPPPDASAQTIAADKPVEADIIARREGYVLPKEKRTVVHVPNASSPQTVRRVEKEFHQQVRGVELLRTLTNACEHNGQNVADADPQSLELCADSGQEKPEAFASAAFEADKVGTLELAVTQEGPYWGKYTEKYSNCFVGFVADYHTAKGYTRRVKFPIAPLGTDAQNCSRPWWGVFGQKDAEPAYLIPLKLADTMKIDLGAYAPDGWDGRVLFGVHVDCCGIGTSLQARVISNGPPGVRLAQMPQPPAPQTAGGKAAVGVATFQNANIHSIEGGAKAGKDAISFPSDGLIEATGLGVVTWKFSRTTGSKAAELWINYQVAQDKYHLQKVPLAEKVKPGDQTTFDIDFRQYAPKDWTGRCRCRLVGDGITAEIIGNTTFQIF